MLQGVKFKANPTTFQKKKLSQWMGCARFVWNAKCDEEKYHSTFARKYYPIGTYAPIDRTTSHFKDKELTPFLSECPFQILGNSANNWYRTFIKFIKGQCGKPKHKIKGDKESIHLPRELFRFERCNDGVLRLFIGNKKNNIGYLSFKAHKSYSIPKSIYIKRERGQYTVSFCYEDDIQEEKSPSLEELREYSPEYLSETVIGIDRGIVIPVQAGDHSFDFTTDQKLQKDRKNRLQKRLQKRIARQQKASNRRKRTKQRIAKACAKISNIRKDFCHKTSRKLVNQKENIFVFEDLSIFNMTKRPKKKQDEKGHFLPNKASQKAGLNRSILDKGWYQLETYTKYKAKKEGKIVLKVSANHTSQECADCGHIHPNNRKSQSDFCCMSCGHIDNADRNASMVIKKRAIKLIQDTGTVLSKRGVLHSFDTGRGAKDKTPVRYNLSSAVGREASKKMDEAAIRFAA